MTKNESTLPPRPRTSKNPSESRAELAYVSIDR